MTGRAFALGDNQVISYTFEAPQGGTDAAQAFLTSHPEKYFTLHNAISAIDPVPYVAMTAFGFKRYGIDHYLPGLSTLETTGLPAEESAYTFTYGTSTHTVVKKTIAAGHTVTTTTLRFRSTRRATARKTPPICRCGQRCCGNISF